MSWVATSAGAQATAVSSISVNMDPGSGSDRIVSGGVTCEDAAVGTDGPLTAFTFNSVALTTPVAQQVAGPDALQAGYILDASLPAGGSTYALAATFTGTVDKCNIRGMSLDTMDQAAADDSAGTAVNDVATTGPTISLNISVDGSTIVLWGGHDSGSVTATVSGLTADDSGTYNGSSHSIAHATGDDNVASSPVTVGFDWGLAGARPLIGFVFAPAAGATPVSQTMDGSAEHTAAVEQTEVGSTEHIGAPAPTLVASAEHVALVSQLEQIATEHLLTEEFPWVLEAEHVAGIEQTEVGSTEHTAAQISQTIDVPAEHVLDVEATETIPAEHRGAGVSKSMLAATEHLAGLSDAVVIPAEHVATVEDALALATEHVLELAATKGIATEHALQVETTVVSLTEHLAAVVATLTAPTEHRLTGVVLFPIASKTGPALYEPMIGPAILE